MGREIRLNAFTMNCVGHQSPGLWTHPRDRSAEYTSLHYWADLARILERGLFDGVFLADVLGVYDVYGGNGDAAIRRATQIPANDPLMVIPAMAMVTEHLGFGATLDHLTNGRIGWNIVTGYLDSAARAMGRPGQTAHDDRYDVADDYMTAVYKLWEGSWADDAVVRDRTTGVFARPQGVHRVHHAGPHVALDTIHLSEPSPQRTPVLYQAGSSPRGRVFAAEHAECVFVSGPSPQVVAPRVAALRAQAAALGRGPILVFALMTAILGETTADAERKLAEYRAHVSHEGALALMSGWAGVDLASYRLDEQIRYVENDAGRSAMENITRADPSRIWTVRDVAEHVAIGGIGPVLTGTPHDVADGMEAWIDATGVDGFNLAFVVAHETFGDITDLLVPELQRRGRYKQRYADGTLRGKLFGAGPRLLPPHPAARHRAGPARGLAWQAGSPISAGTRR
jgi:FMN-dependent oxidoreductase (nitrilotriacetate monooxygenase family)